MAASQASVESSTNLSVSSSPNGKPGHVNWPGVPGNCVISLRTELSAVADAEQSLAPSLASNQTSVVGSNWEQVKFPGAYVTPARSRIDAWQSENIRFKTSAMSWHGSGLSPTTPMPFKCASSISVESVWQ